MAGIDFSKENFDAKNPNLYNYATFHNLASIVKALDERGVPIRALHTTSENVSEIIASKGTRGIPVPVVPPVKLSFQQRKNNYDPVRRAIVTLGERLLPDRIAKPIDKALRKMKIL